MRINWKFEVLWFCLFQSKIESWFTFILFLKANSDKLYSFPCKGLSGCQVIYKRCSYANHYCSCSQTEHLDLHVTQNEMVELWTIPGGEYSLGQKLSGLNNLMQCCCRVLVNCMQGALCQWTFKNIIFHLWPEAVQPEMLSSSVWCRIQCGIWSDYEICMGYRDSASVHSASRYFSA